MLSTSGAVSVHFLFEGGVVTSSGSKVGVEVEGKKISAAAMMKVPGAVSVYQRVQEMVLSVFSTDQVATILHSSRTDTSQD